MTRVIDPYKNTQPCHVQLIYSVDDMVQFLKNRGYTIEPQKVWYSDGYRGSDNYIDTEILIAYKETRPEDLYLGTQQVFNSYGIHTVFSKELRAHLLL